MSPAPPARRRLPDDVVVQSGLAVEDLWDRFELFEALHHTMAIASPMSSRDLDRVVDLLALDGRRRVLDVACGYGELLKRLRRQAVVGGDPFEGVGVDLSPWMIATAAAEPDPALRWVVAEARSLLAGVQTAPTADTSADDPALAAVGHRRWDVVCCLGASWIWYGLHGTIRALADLVEPGGLVAVGDMHIRPDRDPGAVLESHGRVDSLDDIDGWFRQYGIEVVDRVSTSDQDWDAYHDLVDHAASAWARRPDQRHRRDQDWLDEVREWRTAADRDRSVLTWSVWVGRKL